jgi:putative flippase GtrA
MIYGPFFYSFFLNINIKIYTVHTCLYAAIHPGYVLAVYLAISSLTFPFVWQTKVTFYNKDQSSSRKREKKREF